MRSSWNPWNVPSAQTLAEMKNDIENIRSETRNTRHNVMTEMKSIHDIVAAISRDLAAFKELLMASVQELQAKADETLANITAETDIDNAVALVVTSQVNTITDLRAQLAAAIAAGNDPAALAALMTTMDNILALNTSNTKIVSDAVVAGTPAATP